MVSSRWDASKERSLGVAEPELGGFATAPSKKSQHILENAITDSRNPWKPYSSTKTPSTETCTSVVPGVRDRGPRRGDACAYRPRRLPSIAETREADREHDAEPVDQHHWRPLVALQVPWTYRAPAAEHADQAFSYDNAVGSTAITHKKRIV